MTTAKDVLSLVADLPDNEQQAVKSMIGLGPPPPSEAGPLWLITVGSFAVLLVGGGASIVALILTGKDTKDLLPLVTAAVGVLAGLLAPSPATR
jgi:hypothetical protein